MSISQSSIALIRHADLGERMIHIPLIVWTYLKTFFFPVRLISSQFWYIEKINFSNFYLPLVFDTLFFSGVIYGGFYLYKKNNSVEKKLFNHYLFFFIWFILGLGLHIQLYPLDMTVAERWFYFPSIGLIGMGIVFSSQITWKSFIQKRIIISVLVIVVVLLALRTHLRNYDWKDAVILYTKDLQGIQGNYILENALATEFISLGEYKRAKPYVLSSVKTQPFFANLNNLAIIYVEEGNINLAKKTLIEALKDQKNFYVYENYANFLLVYDTPQQTKIFTEYALKSISNNARLLIVFAQAEYFLNNEEKALEYAERAVRLNSNQKIQKIYLRIKRGQPIIQLQKQSSTHIK
jgi:tetratricopeptide (TPR) repeat protein